MTAEPVAAVICVVGGQHYAIPVAYILEVAALVRWMPIPEAPPEVVGVVNRHDAIIPLLDLRLCLGQSAETLDLSSLFIVVEGDGTMAGLIVDDVREVTTLSAEAMRLATNSGPYVRGMTVLAGHPVLVLDTAVLLRTFAPPDLVGENDA